MGKYLKALKKIREDVEVSEATISFDITVDAEEDSQDVMDALNDYYAEGNNVFDHIGDAKVGSKKVVTVTYKIKKDKKSAEKWAKSISQKLKRDEEYLDVEYTVN